VFSEPKPCPGARAPISPAVVAMLRKHRTEQKAERLRAGNQWQDSGLVFTRLLRRKPGPFTAGRKPIPSFGPRSGPL